MNHTQIQFHADGDFVKCEIARNAFVNVEVQSGSTPLFSCTKIMEGKEGGVICSDESRANFQRQGFVYVFASPCMLPFFSYHICI